jgi:polyhydroxyalkanoate synthase
MTTNPPSVASKLDPDRYRNMDRYRHAQRELFDWAGFGPHESRYTVVHEETGLRLRKYDDSAADGPVLLIVPAPIKRPYIWDIAPEASVIRRCLDQGMQVYLAEWVPVSCHEHPFGLEDYSERLLSVCQREIAADSGQERIMLAGHSLGGLLAAMYTCLHPEAVRALVVLESPLHFGENAGSFAPMVASVEDAKPIAATFGDVPGSFLNAVSAAAAPHAFQWERLIDRYMSMVDPFAFRLHMRVERWTYDEFPLPGKLFHEIVELLYRHDQFMQGTLRIGDRTIGPHDLTAPLLSVVDPRSKVIPPSSVEPFHNAAASTQKELLYYEGDLGVNIQHVGVLVGASAHANLWPRIFEFLEAAPE